MESKSRKPITITIDPGDSGIRNCYVEMAFPECKHTARELHDMHINLGTVPTDMSYAMEGIPYKTDKSENDFPGKNNIVDS